MIPIPDHPRTATDITESIRGLGTKDREKAFLDAILGGHVPSYMRTFIDVSLAFVDKAGVGHNLTIRTFPDYLTLGTETDRLRVPLWPLTAQAIADAWDCVLPTTKLVTLLWHASKQKMVPQPWGPPYDASMYSTKRFVAQNAKVEKQIAEKGFDCSKLIVGHAKDVVLTNKLLKTPDRVAIFGWIKSNAKPIQPLYLGHENFYSDYSHHVRLISKKCLLDDHDDDLVRIMQDLVLHTGVSDEGPMQVVRQPLT